MTNSVLAGLTGSSPAPAALDAEANDAVVHVAMVDEYYTVKPGDSLAAIAIVYYDTSSAYTRIFEANRDTLNSADRIRVGQTLLIPR